MIFSPRDLAAQYALSPTSIKAIASSRLRAQRALRMGGEFVWIVGPCSLHDERAALEYAHRLHALAEELKIFVVMRAFVEKPRTRLGWKGMLYDPDLDGSNDLVEGLRKARSLLVALASIVPLATECLDPLIAPYFSDLITWGVIGARTSASQIHRQLASGLSFPVGFKNPTDGDLDTALHALHAARASHTHFALSEEGILSSSTTQGNLFSHLILRGTDQGPNYRSLHEVQERLERHHLPSRLLVDCAHGNSGKHPRMQIKVCEELLQDPHPSLAGIMLESFLEGGSQPIPDDPASLRYGVSITDPCLGWSETADLLRWGASRLMSSVQK